MQKQKLRGTLKSITKAQDPHNFKIKKGKI